MSRSRASRYRSLSRPLCVLAGLLLAIPPSTAQTVQVDDVAIETQFQDTFFGHLKRGRALVAADFNLDGRTDIYVGNPGDESFVAINVPDGNGGYRFDLVQVLVSGEFTWGASTADYDNDGDYDIYVSVGANEGIGYDYLFKNLWIETGGVLQFEDVTDVAGIAGPVPPGRSSPIPVASANGVWGDYDRDGWVDLFVSVNIHPTSLPELLGYNILWHNNGDGTFSNITVAAGLAKTQLETRNSTAFDFDNDGDLDIYESNYEGENVLWRNRLVETGSLTFDDVTIPMSLPGEDLRYPTMAFASTVADFDHDGWQDLFVFKRGLSHETGSPYAPGHALFMNADGTGFFNAAAASGINEGFSPVLGVMGCQIGDLDADGVPDVVVGNGGPPGGEANDLFLSDSAVGATPHYQNRSSLIDFAAPEQAGIQYPSYPYRTHGIVTVDFDGDGLLELGIVNGGMLIQPQQVQEPNRLFELTLNPRPHWLDVRPVGNGTTVSRDAIGARLQVTVSDGGSNPRTLHGTLLGASAFSAQNGFEVFFGLDQADTIDSLRILWPDGSQDTISAGLSTDTSLVVTQDCGQGNCVCRVTEAPETSCSDGIDNDCDGFPDGLDPDCSGPPTATEHHMNAAGPAYAASFGIFFEADRPFQAGDFGFVNGNKAKLEFQISGTQDSELYQAMRYGRGLDYWVDDLPSGSYQVTLYLAEPFATTVGRRVFDVLAEGVVMIDDLDVFAAAGGRRRAHTESFPITVTDGRLELELRPVKNEFLMVSAISVAPAE